jgi:uncharacterized protein (UPF0264 family)
VPLILDRIEAVADTGVDYVKVGMFSQQHIQECLPSFEYHARRGVKIIAVCFADVEFDVLSTVQLCKKACLSGIMMDTAGKKTGSLLQHKTLDQLAQFVNSAQSLGLLTGLAGSLRAQDVGALMPLEADYLGFRTALCQNQIRTAPIAAKSVDEVKQLIEFHHKQAQQAQ